MRHVRRRSLGVIGVALTLGMFLSSCGGVRTTTGGRVAAASTATATDTPLPTATTSAATVESAGCPPIGLGPVQPQYAMVDGLNISIPQRWTALDYPAALMPNNEPNAPYQVPLTASEAQQVGAFHPNPPVNPSLATGYALQVCNQTSAAHTLTSLSVSIASFTPSSGPVTIWHLCQDGPYDAATQQTTGGCGGASGDVDWLAATLPNDSTGATAPAIANAQVHSNGPNLPFAIGPNESIVFLVAVNGLTSQGTYTLSFGVSVDGAAPTPLTPSDGPFLIAPSATVWTGTACQTAAMQAHIPPSSQDTYYVCPPAS
jgi:hypothetical protein